jgi:hypothetical protein
LEPAAFELLDAISRFSKSKMAADIDATTECAELLQAAREIHDAVSKVAAINKMDATLRVSIVHDITELHTSFSKLATIAGEKTGYSHAHP